MIQVKPEDLDVLADILNEVTGNPTEWCTVKKHNGGVIYLNNIGHYYIRLPGGPTLKQTTSEKGEFKDVLKGTSKKELFKMIHAYFMGLGHSYKRRE